MKKQASEKDIRARLQKAQTTKDWGEVVSILDESTEREANVLRSVMPDLITHHNWLVRASAVEAVGTFRQRRSITLVQARLKDRNEVVRSYALVAYYDLLGAKSLSTLKAFCGDRNVRIRVAALALCYAATRDKPSLRTLERILLRKYCRYHNRYLALNVLDYYVDISADPNVTEMFRSILKVTPEFLGLAKDIKKKLQQWESRQRQERDENS
jgi:hypothetical protein